MLQLLSTPFFLISSIFTYKSSAVVGFPIRFRTAMLVRVSYIFLLLFFFLAV